MKKSNATGCLMVLIAASLWGLVGPLMTQMEAAGSTPALTSFIRVFFAGIIMLTLTALRFGPQSLKIDMRTLAFCALLGFVCQSGCNLCYSTAVSQAGVSLSALLVRLSPVFTLIAATMLFSERVTVVKVLTAVMSAIGCGLCAVGGFSANAQVTILGIACGVGAAFCYGMAPIISKFAMQKTHPFVASTYSYLFASIPLLFSAHPWTGIAINPSIIGWGILLAIIPSALGYTMYYSGVNKMTETGKVPIYASTEAVSATVMGMALYGEKLGLAGFVGIGFIAASIYLLYQSESNPHFKPNMLLRKTRHIYPLIQSR